jgi:dienelactone hydrolase
MMKKKERTESTPVPCVWRRGELEFPCQRFFAAGREAALVCPVTAEPNRRWLLKTEYFGAFPGLELEMLARGWHVAWMANEHRWAGAADIEAKKAWIEQLAGDFHLNRRCVPVGMSAGGAMAVKLAAACPERISALYLDAPALNYLSFLGLTTPEARKETAPVLEEILAALQMDLSRLLCWREHPMDFIPGLVQRRIPLALVYGREDKIVPWRENARLLEQAYEGSGVPFVVFAKEKGGHHPHGLTDPSPIADFIVAHTLE